tara:strand:+ start:778 stop:1743 length:966 start_codon:yes stop_codon:yes gene_type:complete
MQIIDKIKEVPPKILVIGDIMLDRFIFGNVHRISPEAPVPIVQSMEEKYSLGGCGNVLRNLINLGVRASIISLIGLDQAGKKIKEDLKQKGIMARNIVGSKSIRTTEKMRIVAEGQQLVRVDWDANKLTKQNLNQVLEQVSKKIMGVDGVIISDYDKGVCTELVLKEIINKAKELHIPVFVDPKGKKWNKYYGASIITPNLKEAEDILGKLLKSDSDIEKAGMEICNDLGLDACLITRGPNGMSYISKDVKFHIKSEAKEIYDVSGAGDTVIASFATATLAGFDSESVTRFANKAAGIVVGHIGTTAIRVSELLEGEDSNR